MITTLPRTCRRPLWLAMVAAFSFGPAHAQLPMGAQVVHGSAGIATVGKSMTITNSPSAILNWQSFNVGAGTAVNFAQQSAASAVLNRVVGADPSKILGQLSSNGKVFLINPNGILFGQGARIDVAGLVASTLNITDTDFLNNRLNFTTLTGSPAGTLINQGNITTPSGGQVYLIGSSVTNEGIITSPKGEVILAAGRSATLLDTGTPNVTVNLSATDQHAINVGQVIAAGGSANIYGALVKNSGLVSASSAVMEGGRVVLKATKTLELTETSKVGADGTAGGRVIALVSEDGKISGTLTAKGEISARGNDSPNSGGFVETSAAKVSVDDAFRVKTDGGTWLIDPNDYTIAASGGDISGATLSTNLGSGNVVILSSSGGTAGSGDIHVNDAVSWSANNLTLTAARDININAVMTASGTSSLTMNTATFNGADVPVAGGIVKVGFNPDGSFKGRVDFPGRSGAGFLTINGSGYTVINNLGAAGSTTGLDLQGMNGNLGGKYALGSDIDASATSGWNGGAGLLPIIQFTGTLNGLGHAISGLTINRPSTNYVGLIGFMETGSLVENVGVGGNVLGSTYVGGLVGYNPSGKVSNSYAIASVSGEGYVGGLVGNIGYNGTISNSHAAGTVSASAYSAGGLVGHIDNGTVINSYYNVDNVTIQGGNYVTPGGLYSAQYQDWLNNSKSLNIASYSASLVPAGGNTYTVSDVQGMKDLLGFADNPVYTFRLGTNIDLSSVPGLYVPLLASTFDGMGYEISNLNVAQSFNGFIGLFGQLKSGAAVMNTGVSGNVSGKWYVGGLVGQVNNSSTVTNSYSTVNVSGQQSVGGLAGVNAGAISNSYTAGSVSGSFYVGGLAGTHWGTVTNSYAMSNVTSGTQEVGGLIGNGTGQLVNSHYDIDNVTIKGAKYVTLGGLYNTQYQDWFNNSKSLNIASYGASLVPAGGNIYTISSAQGMKDLLGFADNAAYTFRLGTNIDLSSVPGLYVPFLGGTFDGMGYLVSNLNVNQNFNSYIGLFGRLGSGATITNTGISGTVSGLHFVGGLVGSIGTGSTVSNSYAMGSVSGQGYVGGLVGYSQGSVNNNHTTNSVVGSTYVGGLVGFSMGNVSNSYATGSISGSSYVGGLVGYSWIASGSGGVSNSYATGDVSGSSSVGGLVGGIAGGTVSGSYATGSVSGSSNVGGLLGFKGPGTVSSSFYNKTVNPGRAGFGNIGTDVAGTVWGMSQTDLRFAANFTSATTANGNVNPNWDFSTAWTIDEGISYPYLRNNSPTQLPGTCLICTWDGGGAASKSWSLLTNWTNDTAPSVGSSVTIGNGYGTILYDRPSLSLDSITTDSTLDIQSSKALTLTGNGIFNAALSLGANATLTAQDTLSLSASPTLASGAKVNISQSGPGILTIGGQAYTVINSLGAAGSTTGLDLQGINGNLSGRYALGSDINASTTNGWNVGAGFVPIGNLTTRFTGSFDGLGHTVSNLTINRPTTDYVGLFGFTDSAAVIRNVGLVGGSISGATYVGGLAGRAAFGTIDNSYATGSVSGSDLVGGLVGFNTFGTIGRSYAMGSVSGTGGNYVGGLVGYNSGTISDSYAAGNVSGPSGVGGLTGVGYGTLSNSHYNIDSVLINGSTGYVTAGGLYSVQYNDWLSHGLTLDIANYAASLPGSGNLYSIGSVQGMKDLLGFADNPAYTFTLNTNIDLAGAPNLHVPVMAADFDGAGFTIANLNLNQPFSEPLGLFGWVKNGSTINNLGVLNATVNGWDYVGGLVGRNSGAVNNSYVTGSVSGSSQFVGGLVGYNSGTISDSYATGSVSGWSQLGGLAGYNSGAISDSYAMGSVSGIFSDVGGLIGSSGGGMVTSSFWDTETSGRSTSAGGIGLSSAQMMTQANFTSAGWDFASTWVMYEGQTRPLLRSFLTPLTVTANNAIKTYDANAYSGGNGVAYSIATPVLSGTLTYGGTAQGAINAGSYTITPAGFWSDQQGYDISYVSGVLAIDPAVIVGNLTASTSKVYGGTALAVLNPGNYLLTGWAGSDGATVTKTMATYDDKNVGGNKNVTASLLASDFSPSGGTLLSNYMLPTSVSGNIGSITAANLTVTGISAQNKIYDTTTAATLSGSATVAALGADIVSVGGTGTGTFSTKNVGTGKAVTVSGYTLSGSDAGNYTVVQPAGLAADITAANLTVTGISAQNKIYDGNTTATVSGTAIVTALGSDVVSVSGGAANFADRNASTGKTVTVSGYMLSGADAGNYTLVQPAPLSADITPLSSVTWVGTSGNWSDAANWTGGALPDGRNVLNVVVPAGASVTYDAATGGTFLNSLTSSGTVALAGGTLDIAQNFTTPTYTQSGGSLTGAGNLTVSSQTTMSGGNINMGGTVWLKSTGDLDLGPIQAGNLIVEITGILTARDVLLANSIKILAQAIGQNANHLRTQTSNLWLVAINGGVWTDNNGSVILGRAESTGNLEIDGTGSIDTGIYPIRSSAGAVRLSAYGNIAQNADISASSIELTSSTGNIYVASGVTSTVPSGSTITLSAAQGAVTTTGSNFSVIPTVTDAASIAVAAAVPDVVVQSMQNTVVQIELVQNSVIQIDTTPTNIFSSGSSTVPSIGNAGPTTTVSLPTSAPATSTTAEPVASTNPTTTAATTTATPETTAGTGSVTTASGSSTDAGSGTSTTGSSTSGTASTASGSTESGDKVAAKTEDKSAAGADSRASAAGKDSKQGASTADKGTAANAATNLQAMASAIERRQEIKTAALAGAIDTLRQDPGAADLPDCGGGADLCIASPRTTQRAPVVVPSSARLPQIERKIALVLGVEDYSGPISSLKTPGRDAEAVSSAYANKLGYEVRTLKNPTKGDIVREINRVIGEAHESDSVMIYYAGHGYVLEESQTGYWIPADGSAKSPANWISNRDITRMLNNISAKQVMLVSDSCFSGKLTEGAAAPALPAIATVPADILQKRSVVVLSSGGDEPVADQGRDGHSIFAHHLLKTLGTLDGVTAGQNVFEAVRTEVSKEFPQQPQYAPVSAAGHQAGGEFLFELRERGSGR